MRFVLLYSDICVFAFLGLLILLFLWARRRREYREAARRILSNRFATICLCVICIYGAIAVLDSVHFRKRLSGQPETAQAGSRPARYGALHSALDWLLLRVYGGIRFTDGRIVTSLETTYSAPLAETSYDKIPDPETGEWRYRQLEAPRSHIWGTNKAGDDVFYNLLKGTRTALVVGLITTMLAIPFAIIFGVTAGYFGGKLDDVIQFIYITLGSIPGILLISAMMIIVRNKFQLSATDGRISAYLQDDKVVLFLCMSLGLISWSGLCRLLRGETLKIRELDYVEAARAIGVSDAVLITQHIIPNVMHVVIINSILRFSGLVMVEAILAYINIGVPSTIHSWGRVVDGAREQLGRDPVVWWPVAGAFVMMFFLVLSINIFGDTVRDALDPRLRE